MAQAEKGDYVRQLEDAVHILWAELPMEQVRILRDEAPALVEFLVHLHHSLTHEQAMVRRNVWATPIDRSAGGSNGTS